MKSSRKKGRKHSQTPRKRASAGTTRKKISEMNSASRIVQEAAMRREVESKFLGEVG